MAVEQIAVSGSNGIIAFIGEGKAELRIRHADEPKTVSVDMARRLLGIATDLAIFGGEEREAALQRYKRDEAVSEALIHFMLLCDPGIDPDGVHLAENAKLLRDRLDLDDVANELFRRMLRAPLPDILDLGRVPETREPGMSSGFLWLIREVQPVLRNVRTSLERSFEQARPELSPDALSDRVATLQTELADGGAYEVGGDEIVAIDWPAAAAIFRKCNADYMFESWSERVRTPEPERPVYDNYTPLLVPTIMSQVPVISDQGFGRPNFPIAPRRAWAPKYRYGRDLHLQRAREIGPLLDLGAHIGRKSVTRDPIVESALLGQIGDRAIFDLQVTADRLALAAARIRSAVLAGGHILFAGRGHVAEEGVRTAARRSGQFAVAGAWSDGLLSDWQDTRRQLRVLGLIGQRYRERSAVPRQWMRDLRDALQARVGGLAGMDELPSLLVVVDGASEAAAIAEARSLDIPVIAILDADGSAEGIDISIPAGLTSAPAVRFYCAFFADAARVRGNGWAPFIFDDDGWIWDDDDILALREGDEAEES